MASSAKREPPPTPRRVSIDSSADEFPMVDVAGDVPFFHVDSVEPLPDLADALPSRFPRLDVTLARGPASKLFPDRSSRIWLSGDVLMCACPDCGAPMTIREWLMIADCWSCGTSIELTQYQEREARRLAQRRDTASGKRSASVAPRDERRRHGRSPAAESAPSASSAATDAAPVPRAPAAAVEAQRDRVPTRFAPAPATSPSPPPPPPGRHPPPPPTSADAARPVPGTSPHARRRPVDRTRARIRELSRTRRARAWIRDPFRHTPAWLISFVFHLVLLTLLGLWPLGGDRDGPYITLSVSVSPRVREGGENLTMVHDETAYDLPVPVQVDLNDPDQREVMIRADQDARELRVDPDTTDPHLPELSAVKEKMSKSGEFSAALVARDPRLRVEIVNSEGGTTLTEAAVARGLRWLARQQKSDGRWVLDGGVRSESAATSLALMPFLGAGQTHLFGRYQDTVSRGLRWMIQQQGDDGDLRGDSRGNTGMYAHGQAAIVLCEAFLMTGDEQLRIPAQKSIDFIQAAQYRDGGWRYQPFGESRPDALGDTSVVGWQLMALQSARAANLSVDPDTLERASHYLDTVQSHDGSRYAYQRGRSPTHVMTAEALLCRIYLGWSRQDPGLADGIRYLEREHPPTDEDHNIYYWYYGTQTLHHYGGPAWRNWNRRMRDVLVGAQEKRGSDAGSWRPASPHSGGRLYETSLAVCTLEVYYRHLPIFRQIDTD